MVWVSAELGTWGALWMWYAADNMPSPILECHTHIPLGLGTQTLFAADLYLGSLCGQPHVFWPPFQNSSSEKSALGTWDLTVVPSQEHSGFVSLIA